jgi:hypothetical protein
LLDLRLAVDSDRNGFSQAVKRMRAGKPPQPGAPEPQSGLDPRQPETWRLERDVCERVARQLRCVGDALAWRVFGFQRRYILALCRNDPPGVMGPLRTFPCCRSWISATVPPTAAKNTAIHVGSRPVDAVHSGTLYPNGLVCHQTLETAERCEEVASHGPTDQAAQEGAWAALSVAVRDARGVTSRRPAPVQGASTGRPASHGRRRPRSGQEAGRRRLGEGDRTYTAPHSGLITIDAPGVTPKSVPKAVRRASPPPRES